MKFTEEHITHLVMLLVGPINPIGCAHEDGIRFTNLKRLIDITDELLVQIQEISSYKNSYEASVIKAEKLATEFLVELRESLEEVKA